MRAVQAVEASARLSGELQNESQLMRRTCAAARFRVALGVEYKRDVNCQFGIAKILYFLKWCCFQNFRLTRTFTYLVTSLLFACLPFDMQNLCQAEITTLSELTKRA